ncbi:MAG: hypothetical protein SVV03_00070 [Candidatus Nanohaloarchaea archaeon]|nr:hypothetical protein [Candidatus Nanohaloarchaea archaeon]
MDWEDVAMRLPEEYRHELPEAYEFVYDDFDVGEYVSDPEEVTDADLKPMVFIAGPYSSPYPVYNMRRSMGWYDVLAESDVVAPHCPHWTGFQDLVLPQEYENWLELDKQFVRRSDAMLRLKGDSSGADGEVELMEDLERPVFYEEPSDGEKGYTDLLEWAVDWIDEKNS